MAPRLGRLSLSFKLGEFGAERGPATLVNHPLLVDREKEKRDGKAEGERKRRPEAWPHWPASSRATQTGLICRRPLVRPSPPRTPSALAISARGARSRPPGAGSPG